jgi:hypothetical protein
MTGAGRRRLSHHGHIRTDTRREGSKSRTPPRGHGAERGALRSFDVVLSRDCGSPAGFGALKDSGWKPSVAQNVVPIKWEMDDLTQQFRYAALERALIYVFDVPTERRGALNARIKNLAKFGVPYRRRPGCRGAAVTYTFEQSGVVDARGPSADR